MLPEKGNCFMGDVIQNEKPCSPANRRALFEPASCRCQPCALHRVVTIWMSNKIENLRETLVQLLDSRARDPKDEGVSPTLIRRICMFQRKLCLPQPKHPVNRAASRCTTIIHAEGPFYAVQFVLPTNKMRR